MIVPWGQNLKTKKKKGAPTLSCIYAAHPPHSPVFCFLLTVHCVLDLQSKWWIPSHEILRQSIDPWHGKLQQEQGLLSHACTLLFFSFLFVLFPPNWSISNKKHTQTNLQVSLRGASAKEISRDALLEKASLERSIRSEARKAASAAHLIQVFFSLFPYSV